MTENPTTMDDLATYLDVFGSDCVRPADGATFRGVLDMDEVEFDAGADGIDGDSMELFFQVGTVTLKRGDVLTIDGETWRVRGNAKRVDDGKFAVVGVIQ